MTLIKLDSGDYINTEFVEWLGEDSDRGNQPLVRVRGYAIEITSADRNHIVEAINGSAVTTAQQDGLKPFTAEDFKLIGRGEA